MSDDTEPLESIEPLPSLDDAETGDAADSSDTGEVVGEDSDGSDDGVQRGRSGRAVGEPVDPAKRRVARQMVAGAVALVLIAGALAGVWIWNDDADSVATVAANAGDGAEIGEHRHAFFGLSVCGGPAAPAPPSPFGYGVFSDGQGIMHLAPTSDDNAGANATINAFLGPLGLVLTPEGAFSSADAAPVFTNGTPCTEGSPLAGQPADLALMVNGAIVEGDAGSYAPADGDVIVVYIAPAGQYVTGAELFPLDETTGEAVDPLNLLATVVEPPGYTPELASIQGRCLSAPQPAAPSAAPPQFPEAPALTIDPGAAYTATITTTCGDVVIALDAAAAPNTVNSFVFLAGEGYFDNTPFHRIIPGFVVQGGDPTGSGTGSPGYTIADENLGANFVEGTLAMANAGPDTNGSQFFIVSDPAGAEQLNASPLYSIFGQVTEGLDIVAALESLGDPAGSGQPVAPLYVLSVSVTET